MDGLQLTVEKIHLTTNNVKELLHKITEEKSDQSGETQQPTNQSAMGALPQGMPTLNTVAGGVSNAADGMVKLGKATATRVAAIGQPAKKHEPKDSKVCLKKVEVRSIVRALGERNDVRQQDAEPVLESSTHPLPQLLRVPRHPECRRHDPAFAERDLRLC